MGLFEKTIPAAEIRVVHLDLKGCQPTPKRLLEHLDVYAAAKYNAVLVEWEDTFPWTVDERFRSPTAYTPEEVKAFVAKCKELDIGIIHLVQCLGHMQTPLNVPGYEHLREVPEACDVLNPLANGARELVQKMVDDVLELVPDVRFFHLGGDEAWSFGSHPDTKAYIEEHGKGALYMHHIEPILDSLNDRNIRPILWNDMMNKWEDEALDAISSKADMCVWGYGKDPIESGGHSHRKHLERFRQHNVRMWGAGAYKGASGANVDITNYAMHESNALSWAKASQEFGLVGLVATAWSRYNTCIEQCEPTDANFDSLVNVGAIFHDGEIPSGGRDECETFIESIGEGECYCKCREAAEKLTQLRKRGWFLVQQCRERIVLCENDQRRIDGRTAQSLVPSVVPEKAPGVETAVKEAFSGLIPEMWIDAYLRTRLQPLKDEYELLKARAAKLKP